MALRTSQIAYYRDQIVALIHADLKLKGIAADEDYPEWMLHVPDRLILDVTEIASKAVFGKRGKKGIGSKP
jgi:hypothetical protein